MFQSSALTASTSKFLKYEEDSSSEAKWTRRSFPRLRKRRYQEFFILVFPPTLTPALECYAPSNQPPFSFHPCIHPTAIRREPPFPMVTIYSGDAWQPHWSFPFFVGAPPLLPHLPGQKNLLAQPFHLASSAHFRGFSILSESFAIVFILILAHTNRRVGKWRTEKGWKRATCIV